MSRRFRAHAHGSIRLSVMLLVLCNLGMQCIPCELGPETTDWAVFRVTQETVDSLGDEVRHRYVVRALTEQRTSSYLIGAPFGEDADERVRDAAISAAGSIAIVTRNRKIKVISGESTEAFVGGVAVGWANAADRLAVVALSGDQGLKLRVLTESLEPVATYSLDLLQRTPERTNYAVSWSADDTLVAISTRAERNVTLTSAARVQIVDLSAGTSVGEDLSDFFFTGDRTAIAATRNGNVSHVDLVNGSIVMGEPVCGAKFGLSSWPAAGVYAVEERPKPALLPLVYGDTSVRTVDGSQWKRPGFWIATTQTRVAPADLILRSLAGSD